MPRTGQPLTQKVVQDHVRRAARRASTVLRHTFAIQRLAGHQDISTTQRYMHLSLATMDNAIALVEQPVGVAVRDNLETATGAVGNCNR